MTNKFIQPPLVPQNMFFTWLILAAFSMSTNAEQSIAYQLSPQDETGFYRNESAQPAAFWSRWETGEEVYEARLSSADNSWNRTGDPFSSAQDAALTLRFAWGDSGLYVHCAISDDTIAAAPAVSLTPLCSTDTRLGDAIDLFFEQNAWAALEGGDIVGTFPLNRCASFGYGTTHLQVSCLPRAEQDQYRLTRYSYSVMGLEIQSGSLEQAYLTGKIVLRSYTLSGTQAIVEMCIPWSQWGSFGFSAPPQEGSVIGISGGYNDYDPQEPQSFNSLRLVPGIDPAGCTQSHSEPRCKPWADLVLGPLLPGTNTRQTIKAWSSAKTAPANGDWFTVTGKRIPAQAIQHLPVNSFGVSRNGRVVLQKGR